MASLQSIDPFLASVLNEEQRARSASISLIASENIPLPEVSALASSEFLSRNYFGNPIGQDARRPPFYPGHEAASNLQTLAIERVKGLFHCNHANVQPLSGTLANSAVFKALDEKLCRKAVTLSLDFVNGGHFSHGGDRDNCNADARHAHGYGVCDDGSINYDDLENRALNANPKPDVIIVGGSSYTHDIDFVRVREIADKIGALVWYDMAQVSGLIAGGAMRQPFEHGVDIATSSTHKTIRGVKGGFIAWNDPNLSRFINDAVAPGIQGETNIANIAANALAFLHASSEDYGLYAHQTIKNANLMAEKLMENNIRVLGNGTETHFIMVDLRPLGLKGEHIASALANIGLLCNKQAVPGDTDRILNSGIRIGTPAATSQGFSPSDFTQIANIISNMIHVHAQTLQNIGLDYSQFHNSPEYLAYESTQREQVQEIIANAPFQPFPYAYADFALTGLPIRGQIHIQ